METSHSPHPSPSTLSPRVFWLCFAAILFGGAYLRWKDTASWRHTGFDELIYRRYVYLMDGGKQRFSVFQEGMALSKPFEYTIKERGAAAMPEVTALYLATQKDPKTMCELPPTRFGYLYPAWLWKNLSFGDTVPFSLSDVLAEKRNPPTDPDYSRDMSRVDPALASLNQVARFFSLLLVAASGLFGWRLLGRGAGLAVMALMAVDPLTLHLSQHVMIDGVFAFWALMCLWTTWECLRAPANTTWQITHAACLAMMVMTKENALFVYVALGAIVVANRWLKFGTVTTRFLGYSIVGPAIGLGTLIILAGGASEFLAMFRTFKEKADVLEFTKLYGDGPWYRYLIDLLTMSPIILCLALGGWLALGGRRKEIAFCAVFVVVTYAIMCNIPNGMNLRFASIWVFPLRVAAVLMIWELCARWGRHQWVAATMLIAGLCTYEARQFMIFTANPARPFYEVVPHDMLRQIGVLKKKEDLFPATSPP